MFAIAKKSHWLQTQVIRAIASVHPAIEHNIGKIAALKKAFYLANLEDVAGDYVEFGMYEGTSFIGAFECHMGTRLPLTPARAFWGYDSFSGFKYSSDSDTHPFFREGDFSSSYEATCTRVARHFRDRAKWMITPGYVEDTIKGRKAADVGIGKIAVAFIDLDLGEPARVALDFIRPALQGGSIIIFDDFFAYRGSRTRGVAGAFEAFRCANLDIEFRRIFDYGYGGQALIVVEPPASTGV